LVARLVAPPVMPAPEMTQVEIFVDDPMDLDLEYRVQVQVCGLSSCCAANGVKDQEEFKCDPMDWEPTPPPPNPWAGWFELCRVHGYIIAWTGMYTAALRDAF